MDIADTNETADAIQKQFDTLIERMMAPVNAISDDQEKAAAMQRLMIGAYVAFSTRTKLYEKVVRPFFDRNTWRKIDSDIQDHVDKFMARAADGQPGVRRVK